VSSQKSGRAVSRKELLRGFGKRMRPKIRVSAAEKRRSSTASYKIEASRPAINLIPSIFNFFNAASFDK
jgi:hypothetical protein